MKIILIKIYTFLLLVLIIIFNLLPTNISKIDDNYDLKNYNPNFLNNFNQLDIRHWIVLANNTIDHTKKSKYIKNAILLSSNNERYNNYSKFLFYQNFDIFNEIDKNIILDNLNDD